VSAAADGAKYFFDAWPSAGGVEISVISAMAQTQDGYLWLGTYHGLVRFDGVRFVVFNSMNAPGLQNGRITALCKDDSGTLWIAHETGDLTAYHNGEFHPVRLGFSWVGGPIEDLRIDEDGDLWLTSDRGGVFRLQDGQCVLPNVIEKGWPSWMAQDQQKTLWVISNGRIGKLSRAEGFKSERFDETNGAPQKYQRVLPTRDGGLWVLRDNQVGKWKAGKWVDGPRPVAWTNDYASALLEMPSGSLLAGTYRNGLFLLNAGGAFQRFTRADGLASDEVKALREDREGNIWIGTGNGLNAMRVRKVEMLNPPDEWEGHNVLSFWVQPDGSAWIGTLGAGLYHYEPAVSKPRWTCVHPSNASFIWSVLENRSGELMIGTWGDGLLVAKQGYTASPGQLSGIPFSAGVMALYESKAGELWIGTTAGLQRYANGKLAMIADQHELKVPDVRAITESTDGTLWFGTSGGGLAALKDGALKHFLKEDGLSSDLVYCLDADAGETLWIGTADNGLCRMKNGKISTISLGEDLPSRAIYHIVDDGNGYLWMGSDCGIFRTSKIDLNLCADGKVQTVHCLRYGTAEGLASESCPGGFEPGACKAPDGRLWFPTTKGIAIVDPANVTTNRVPPPVVIEEFLVDGKPVIAMVSSIPPGKQRFEVRYTGLSFAAPDRVRFRYKLDGLETEWVEAGARRVAQYSYLKPGKYRFHVIACNNDEVWNETGASLEFTLLPYFWQTQWFIIAAVASGMGMVGGGVAFVTRQRERRKLHELEKQRALEKERARIARDIHDDLGASLSRIAMLSQGMRKNIDGNSSEAIAAERVNSIARGLTRTMDEIVWALNPKHDTLDSLATYLGGFAQDYLTAAGIRCRLNVPICLPALAVTAEVRHNVFLAFKETLHNVVKHANASEVEVFLETGPNEFELVVADNGCGFATRSGSQTVIGADERQRLGGGNGLSNVRKRLEDVGGRCELETGSGRGTRVKMVIMTNKSLK
jgi:ligand-binding sensor domain-containing protein/signal transduction histidine kinase